jgi:hypothetical protein
MIGRPTGDGTLRFWKAVPWRRDAIDLSFLAVTGIVMSGWRPLIKGYFAVAR